MLGVSECLLGFEVTRHLAPGWAWVWWVWFAVWMVAGVAVLVYAIVRTVAKGNRMMRGGSASPVATMPAQKREAE
jgi:hypothetical protein